MRTVTLGLEEPKIKLLENHGSKFLQCYVWFEGENIKVCITNDKGIIVFSSSCLAPSLSEADITTKSRNIMERVHYHMPNDGIIYLHLNRNEKDEKFQPRPNFDDIFMLDFKRQVTMDSYIGGHKVKYLLEIYH